MDFDFYTPLIFEDDSIKLEPLKPYHLPSLLPIIKKNPDLLFSACSSNDAYILLKDFMKVALGQQLSLKRYPLAIFDKTEERYIGSISITKVSRKNKRIRLGWTWLDRNSPYAEFNKRIRFLLLNYAFETLQCERVEFFTDSRSDQEKQIIADIGGVFEGELRNHYLASDGIMRNTCFFSILRKEWPPIKSELFLSLYCHKK